MTAHTSCIQRSWPYSVAADGATLPLLLLLLLLPLLHQDRESSAALTVFWAGWWPLVLLSFPVIGRAWCAMW
jgi:hypothetical protein